MIDGYLGKKWGKRRPASGRAGRRAPSVYDAKYELIAFLFSPPREKQETTSGSIIHCNK